MELHIIPMMIICLVSSVLLNGMNYLVHFWFCEVKEFRDKTKSMNLLKDLCEPGK